MEKHKVIIETRDGDLPLYSDSPLVASEMGDRRAILYQVDGDFVVLVFDTQDEVILLHKRVYVSPGNEKKSRRGSLEDYHQ